MEFFSKKFEVVIFPVRSDEDCDRSKKGKFWALSFNFSNAIGVDSF